MSADQQELAANFANTHESRKRDIDTRVLRVIAAYEYRRPIEKKHKIPPAYSRADDGARSLTALGMTDLRKLHAVLLRLPRVKLWKREKKSVDAPRVLKTDRVPSPSTSSGSG
jgi:hypothetical protein